jgi:hypothetical protein
MRHVRLVFVTIAIFTLALSFPVSARSTVIEDSMGDATAGTPAYVDLIQAKITDQAGRDTLYFSMVVAGAFPETPPDNFLAYNWFADVDSNGSEDYVVVIRWCTERTVPRCAAAGALPRWEAFVNRFGVGLTFFSSFKIDGAVIKAFIHPALLGDPESFGSYTVTRTVPAGGFVGVDRAPDAGFVAFRR